MSQAGGQDSWSQYHYVFNNPMKYIDLFGMDPDKPGEETDYIEDPDVNSPYHIIPIITSTPLSGPYIYTYSGGYIPLLSDFDPDLNSPSSQGGGGSSGQRNNGQVTPNRNNGRSVGNRSRENFYKTSDVFDKGNNMAMGVVIGSQMLGGSTYGQALKSVPFLEVMGKVTGAIGIVDHYNKFRETGSHIELLEAGALLGTSLFFEEIEIPVNVTIMGIDAYRNYQKTH
jgi:hypothetical protein